MRFIDSTVALVFALTLVVGTYANELHVVGEVEIAPNLVGICDVSGIGLDGALGIVASDETHVVQVIRRRTSALYDAIPPITLPLRDTDDKPEMDLEGVATADGIWYVVGSHSRVRAAGDQGEEDVGKRLGKVNRHKNRDCVLRFRINEEGGLRGDVESVSLHKVFKEDEVLGPFMAIASKENGVDIEGIAAAENRLFLGFRGPVLRNNLVPIVVLDFDRPKHYELRFVNLDGLGVRDITAAKDGFLIIAGPVGDAAGPYRLFEWDGRTCLPEKGDKSGTLKPLGEIPTKEGSKAEGIAILEESDHAFKILVVFDGPPNGQPTIFSVDRD